LTKVLKCFKHKYMAKLTGFIAMKKIFGKGKTKLAESAASQVKEMGRLGQSLVVMQLGK